MLINRNNYETILIDYLDGLLSEAQQREADAFLLANPDIAMEFEALQTCSPLNEPVTFNDKDTLRKIPFAKAQADDDFFTQKCIEKIEGLMPESEEAAFEKMVMAGPAQNQSFQLFRKTRLPLEYFDYNEKVLIKIDERFPALTEANFSAYAIAYIEGWLNRDAKKVVDAYRKNNSHAQTTFSLIERLKVLPDNQIIYPGKELLKKQLSLRSKIQKQVGYWGGVAAIITIGAFAFYMGDSGISGIQQAMETNQSQKLSSGQKAATALTASTTLPNSIKQNVVVESKQKAVNPQQKAWVKTIASENKVEPIVRNNQLADLEVIQQVSVKNIPTKNIQPIDVLKPVNLYQISEPLYSSNNPSPESIEESDKLLNKAVRYGIEKIVALSNGHIRLEQKQNEKRTKVEVETRYFAFSTTTKQINF